MGTAGPPSSSAAPPPSSTRPRPSPPSCLARGESSGESRARGVVSGVVQKLKSFGELSLYSLTKISVNCLGAEWGWKVRRDWAIHGRMFRRSFGIPSWSIFPAGITKCSPNSWKFYEKDKGIGQFSVENSVLFCLTALLVLSGGVFSLNSTSGIVVMVVKNTYKNQENKECGLINYDSFESLPWQLTEDWTI